MKKKTSDKNLEDKKATRSGYVAIIGRPNVGKSTLLNSLLKQKVSITSSKPQTTRHRILGIKTEDSFQTIYVDTPGLHSVQHHKLNRYMNKVAKDTLHDVEAIVFVVEALKWTKEDDYVLKQLSFVSCPVFLVINKIDLIKDKSSLLPHIEKLSQLHAFAEIFPLSAEKPQSLEPLEKAILAILPHNPHFFMDGELSDRPIGFRVAELIREQLVRLLGEELPYSTAVEIEFFGVEDEVQHIYAIIWVEKESQKPIVIGKGGERLKKIGIEARRGIEQLLNRKVHLKLWVKVKSNWSDDDTVLKNLGFE